MEIELLCFICGNQNCQQAYDHSKITSRDFYSLLQTSKIQNSFSIYAKNSLQRIYHLIELANPAVSNSNISQHLTFLSNILKKLDYWYILKKLSSLKDIEGILLGYKIPKNRLVEVIRVLKKHNELRQLQFNGWTQLLQYFDNFENNINVESFFNDKQILSEKLVQQIAGIICKWESIQRKNIKNIAHPSKASKQQLDNLNSIIIQLPEDKNQNFRNTSHTINNQIDYEQHQKDIVFIENVPIQTNRTSLQLSMLKIDDKLLLKYLSSLDKLSLQELYIRNHSMSMTGTRILFNLYPSLQTLDIRNIDIITSFPYILQCSQLKTLYICQTGLYDNSLLILSSSLNKLEKLFSNGNRISFVGAKIALNNLLKLKYLALAFNDLNSEESQIISQIISLRNGYLQI